MSFGNFKSSEDGTTEWKKPSVLDIKECAETALSLIDETINLPVCEDSEPPEKPRTITAEIVNPGAIFLEFLDERRSQGLPPVTVELASGRKVEEVHLIAALALLQCERAARGIKNERAETVAVLMWDLHDLVSRLESGRGEDDVARAAVSSNARRAALFRHEENHAMRAQVYAWCEENFNKFSSMDAAAESVAGTEVPVTFRTARRWIGYWRKQQSARTR